jgi:hypothetical protein
MAEHQITDEVWQHGQHTGAGFTCNYCGCTKRGGGATRFKHHLVARGSNMKHCGSVARQEGGLGVSLEASLLLL